MSFMLFLKFAHVAVCLYCDKTALSPYFYCNFKSKVKDTQNVFSRERCTACKNGHQGCLRQSVCSVVDDEAVKETQQSCEMFGFLCELQTSGKTR